jgi:hypothetical protein
MPGCVQFTCQAFFYPKFEFYNKKLSANSMIYKKLNLKEVTKKWNKFQSIC